MARRYRTRFVLGGVTFMYSIGLAVLLSARRHAASVGCRMRVSSTSPTLAQLFKLCGLDEVLMDSAE
jgi:anti-anti-sigma factor